MPMPMVVNVSGSDAESLGTIAKVYELVVKAGVHKASSIKVAEAAIITRFLIFQELKIVLTDMTLDVQIIRFPITNLRFIKVLMPVTGLVIIILVKALSILWGSLCCLLLQMMLSVLKTG